MGGEGSVQVVEEGGEGGVVGLDGFPELEVLVCAFYYAVSYGLVLVKFLKVLPRITPLVAFLQFPVNLLLQLPHA